jgi:hypothetical protein
MNPPGDGDNLLVAARSALLDALEALDEHRQSVIVVGAQAIYLHTGDADVALAEATKDSDLAIDPRELEDDPLLEEAMRAARFYPNPFSNQPGAWMNSAGTPVDLMVPESFAGPGGPFARSARIPPHDRRSTRRARGLEAALVDNQEMTISALDPADLRAYRAVVAGPAALTVAKAFKIAERQDDPDRLNDKDAHDLYRILRGIPIDQLVQRFGLLLADPVSADVTRTGLAAIAELFASGPDALGSLMAGRAEEGVGFPEQVSLSVSLLSRELLVAVEPIALETGSG